MLSYILDTPGRGRKIPIATINMDKQKKVLLGIRCDIQENVRT